MRGGPSPRGELRRAVPRILSCVGATDRAGIRDAFGDGADLVFIELLRNVLGALARQSQPVTAVILSSRDAEGALAAPVVQAFASRYPHVAVVAYCDVGVLHSEDLRYLAAAGVHEFVFRGANDSGAALRSVVESAIQECAADVVMSRLARLLPPRVHPYAELCLSRPQDARTVASAARMLGLHRKTLVNHCARERLPKPLELMGWFRLMLASHFLETTTRTVEAIALAHDWPSVTSLRNMFRRYVGARATDVRRNGGLAFVVARFQERVRLTREAEEHHHVA